MAESIISNAGDSIVDSFMGLDALTLSGGAPAIDLNGTDDLGIDFAATFTEGNEAVVPIAGGLATSMYLDVASGLVVHASTTQVSVPASKSNTTRFSPAPVPA